MVVWIPPQPANSRAEGESNMQKSNNSLLDQNEERLGDKIEDNNILNTELSED